MSNWSSNSSSAYSYSKGSSFTSKGHSSQKSDKRSSSSGSKTTAILKNDPYASSLSNRAGIDRYVHESAFAGPWNPVAK
ncbi:hypothetical protein N657DRAFT_686444 [Parathielavia appendiculata]|uniref:Uncharacterized protein n=1 Tax=Parathielavia appendiculata TaxID=2587402 RepID=A0AAN6UA97_9PEZI|nr:hypothetical protein N657DRAFT_686444 [Parathielavia appendiculata]